MFCPPNPTTINLKVKKSGAAIFLEKGMGGEAASLRLVSPTTFPGGAAAGKKSQIPTHLVIQTSPYRQPENKISPSVFQDIAAFYNRLKLLYLLNRLKNRITQISLGFSFILYQCNLDLVPACPGPC